MQKILNIADTLPIWSRVFFLILITYIAHLIVVSIKTKFSYYLSVQPSKEHRKTRSIMAITVSAFIFSVYFFALGFILREFGVSLTAYLASASVLGLAIGYGSQGIIQDIVMGLTFIFSDLLDVGDLVEISGQTGIVKEISLRFIKLENALGALVFIPNRSVNNVANYPRGSVLCTVDLTLLGDETEKIKTQEMATELMESTCEQFSGILMTNSIDGNRIKFSNKEIFRLKFHIWPNRGQPIETTFAKELYYSVLIINPNYKEWMIAVNYQVERKNMFIPKNKLIKRKNK